MDHTDDLDWSRLFGGVSGGKQYAIEFDTASDRSMWVTQYLDWCTLTEGELCSPAPFRRVGGASRIAEDRVSLLARPYPQPILVTRPRTF